MIRSLCNLFNRLPSPLEVAARELAEAKLSALREQTVAEYRAAESASAMAMVAFNKNRITRLESFLAEQTKGDDRFPQFNPGIANG